MNRTPKVSTKRPRELDTQSDVKSQPENGNNTMSQRALVIGYVPNKHSSFSFKHQTITQTTKPVPHTETPT